MSLWLVGQQVAFIGVDFQITLRFSNASVVRLESVFSIMDRDGHRTVIDPECDKARFVPVLQLHEQSVKSTRIENSVLTIECSNGSVLEAAPNEDYESWSYTGPENIPTRVIALPGGELAVWSP